MCVYTNMTVTLHIAPQWVSSRSLAILRPLYRFIVFPKILGDCIHNFQCGWILLLLQFRCHVAYYSPHVGNCLWRNSRLFILFHFGGFYSYWLHKIKKYIFLFFPSLITLILEQRKQYTIFSKNAIHKILWPSPIKNERNEKLLHEAKFLLGEAHENSSPRWHYYQDELMWVLSLVWFSPQKHTFINTPQGNMFFTAWTFKSWTRGNVTVIRTFSLSAYRKLMDDHGIRAREFTRIKCLVFGIRLK